MANCCNDTSSDLAVLCMLGYPYVLLGISIFLLLSLCMNVFCCVSRFCSAGKSTCQPMKRQRRGPRQMEDNPIYGNLGHMQTSTVLLTETDPLRRVNSGSQDCYANLTLKPPRLQSGCSSPQIQFSDVVVLEEPLESEKEDEPSTDAVFNFSDLYASVQTQRTKNVQLADSGEEYANHL